MKREKECWVREIEALALYFTYRNEKESAGDSPYTKGLKLTVKFSISCREKEMSLFPTVLY